MTIPEYKQQNAPIESPQFSVVNEKMFPELIQEQIGKLKELDESVKTAIANAEKAADKASEVSKKSAGWSWSGEKKKVAIEELQQSGLDLAQALQSGALAQKISFELQTRLAEVTKYLFTLGVSNIAANRAVVRELELRLHGASEEEISELARQELTSVIRQLKEQEDLLRKQEKTNEELKEHEQKIRYLLNQTNNLNNERHDLKDKTESLAFDSKQQQQMILTLQQQTLELQNRVEMLVTAFAQSQSTLNRRTATMIFAMIALVACLYFLQYTSRA